jgi:UDP-N-acetylglucosamine 2-epimerase (non-hydrolysing)
MSLKILSIFGTRPEAIKMAPLIKQLAVTPGVQSVVCTTGQHRSMLDQVMGLFDLHADHDLDVMVANQTLNGLSRRLLERLDPVLDTFKPDRILVHGDTTTAMVSALAAFHRGIAVGHVEAGLRTGNMRQPWPEEMNRRVVDVVSDLMCAPTAQSRANLLAENLGGRSFVTGNTVIDALGLMANRLATDQALRDSVDARLPALDPARRMLLVTGHRRENFGDGFESICGALADLAQRDDIEIVYPVHLNPNVQAPVHAALGRLPRVHLIEPLDYLGFIRLMQRAHVILTDSGGVQEEAPSLGKPVLVMREVTERPEALAAGVVRLVGTSRTRIVDTVNALFDDPVLWRSFSQVCNPYGDGRASERIVAALLGEEVAEFVPITYAAES